MSRQRGFSFFGIIFLIAILSAVVSIAIKVLPPYMDFLTICDATAGTLAQPRISMQTYDQIKKKIDTNLSINNISLGQFGDDALTLRKEDGNVYADIEYTVVKPVFESSDVVIEITMNFSRTVEARASED
jgi:hypothetical protein